jgi:hypothetical protein
MWSITAAIQLHNPWSRSPSLTDSHDRGSQPLSGSRFARGTAIPAGTIVSGGIRLACFTLAVLGAAAAQATLPPPTPRDEARAKAAAVKAALEAKREALALARAQDRVVEYVKRGRLPKTAANRVEWLSCRTGDEDHHARIGVELVNGQLNYFAFYSKYKPRACSIEVRRGGAFNHWEEKGGTSQITLVDGKGLFRINGAKGGYRFDFLGIDRERYCGMEGKINGSLTVTRGKRNCVVQGVMDGHAG